MGTQCSRVPSRFGQPPLPAGNSPNMASPSSSLNWTTSSSRYKETPLKGPISRPDVTELWNTWFHISNTGWLLSSAVNVIGKRPVVLIKMIKTLWRFVLKVNDFSHEFLNAPKGANFTHRVLIKIMGGTRTQLTGHWCSQLGRCRWCGWPGRVDRLYNEK
jgi:hypothetical protein